MPYTLNENCVVKKDTGETVKCFETRAAAIAHLRALYANVPEADWSNEVKAILQSIEREKLPSVWVRAHPYGKPTMKDVHGEYFDARTNFFDDGKLLSVVPVSYYHNHDDNGLPVGEPTAIGVTSGRKYQGDGRWDRVQFFDNVSDDIKARIQSAIEHGTLRASPTVVPDFHSVANDGHISHWLTGSIAVFDAQGRRQPANPRAIAALTPTQLKALYKAAHLEFPEQVMKSGGNPNHDEQGRFASGSANKSISTYRRHVIVERQHPFNKDETIFYAQPEGGDEFSQMNAPTLDALKKKIDERMDKFDENANNSRQMPSAQEARDKLRRAGMSEEMIEARIKQFGLKADLQVEFPEQVMKGKDMNKDDFFKTARKAWNDFKAAIGMSDEDDNADNDEILTNAQSKADKPPQAANDKDAWEELFGEDAKAENGDDDGNDDDEQENRDTKPASQANQREDDMADSRQQANADELRLEYDNKMKALLDKNAELTARLDRADVEKWLDQTVNADGVKVLPAERDGVIEFALQALRDDRAQHPTMKSADGQATTRFAAFKASIEARTVKIPRGDNQMKFAGFDHQQGAPKSANDVPPERVKELLSLSDMGQKILAEKNGNH